MRSFSYCTCVHLCVYIYTPTYMYSFSLATLGPERNKRMTWDLRVPRLLVYTVNKWSLDLITNLHSCQCKSRIKQQYGSAAVICGSLNGGTILTHHIMNIALMSCCDGQLSRVEPAEPGSVRALISTSTWWTRSLTVLSWIKLFNRACACSQAKTYMLNTLFTNSTDELNYLMPSFTLVHYYWQNEVQMLRFVYVLPYRFDSFTLWSGNTCQIL